MPVKALVFAVVPLEPGVQSSHGAAGVDVESCGKSDPTQPADLNEGRARKMNHQLITAWIH